MVSATVSATTSAMMSATTSAMVSDCGGLPFSASVATSSIFNSYIKALKVSNVFCQ